MIPRALELFALFQLLWRLLILLWRRHKIRYQYETGLCYLVDFQLIFGDVLSILFLVKNSVSSSVKEIIQFLWICIYLSIARFKYSMNNLPYLLGRFGDNVLRWNLNSIFLIFLRTISNIFRYFPTFLRLLWVSFFREIFRSNCIALTISSFNHGVAFCNFGFSMGHVHSNNWCLVCWKHGVYAMGYTFYK